MTRDEQLVEFMLAGFGALMVYTILWLMPVVAEILK